MDDDRRELLRRLFVAATELIETAHDAATTGQFGELAADEYADTARRLIEAADEVAALADAAMVIAHLGQENASNSHRKRSR